MSLSAEQVEVPRPVTVHQHAMTGRAGLVGQLTRRLHCERGAHHKKQIHDMGGEISFFTSFELHRKIAPMQHRGWFDAWFIAMWAWDEGRGTRCFTVLAGDVSDMIAHL